jgi:hypothetical protein
VLINLLHQQAPTSLANTQIQKIAWSSLEVILEQILC